MDRLSAEELIHLFRLEALPLEGGYIRQTWNSPSGTAIYYLITSGSWSAFHRLPHEEVWHFYGGDPAVQFQLLPDGSHVFFELGNHPGIGEVPQVLTPPCAWQTKRLLSYTKKAGFYSG